MLYLPLSATLRGRPSCSSSGYRRAGGQHQLRGRHTLPRSGRVNRAEPRTRRHWWSRLGLESATTGPAAVARELGPAVRFNIARATPGPRGQTRPSRTSRPNVVMRACPYPALGGLLRAAAFVVVPLHPARHACGYAAIGDALAMGSRSRVADEHYSDLIAEGQPASTSRRNRTRRCGRPSSAGWREAAPGRGVGAAARARMVEHFSLERYVSRLEQAVLAAEAFRVSVSPSRVASSAQLATDVQAPPSASPRGARPDDHAWHPGPRRRRPRLPRADAHVERLARCRARRSIASSAARADAAPRCPRPGCCAVSTTLNDGATPEGLELRGRGIIGQHPEAECPPPGTARAAPRVRVGPAIADGEAASPPSNGSRQVRSPRRIHRWRTRRGRAAPRRDPREPRRPYQSRASAPGPVGRC